MKNKWKTIAIIFIILFIIETILLIWLWNYGTDIIEKESECAYNICADYDAYQYTEYDGVCYCYTDGEIVYQEYIG